MARRNRTLTFLVEFSTGSGAMYVKDVWRGDVRGTLNHSGARRYKTLAAARRMAKSFERGWVIDATTGLKVV